MHATREIKFKGRFAFNVMYIVFVSGQRSSVPTCGLVI